MRSVLAAVLACTGLMLISSPAEAFGHRRGCGDDCAPAHPHAHPPAHPPAPAEVPSAHEFRSASPWPVR